MAFETDKRRCFFKLSVFIGNRPTDHHKTSFWELANDLWGHLLEDMKNDGVLRTRKPANDQDDWV